ncbi:MAG: 50S ribosome-binding GTPase [Firmicutes bacterium]|nr:50S ribosome-binding GTPase [Bacillota bacterium]
MARTRRLIRENLGLVAVVIEVADARAPRATRYPRLDRLVPGRPILTVLSKADLADPAETVRWLRALADRGRPEDAATPFAAEDAATVRRVRELAMALGRRSGRGPGVRAMVVGLPNVGKSTLINRLAGRAKARTGDRPGVTRGKQWVDGESGLELLDLPGILVPGTLPRRVALILATLGVLPPQSYRTEEVAAFALELLRRAGRLPPELDGGKATGEGGLPVPGEVLLERFALARGHLRAGGLPDTERAAAGVLDALRRGRFGRLTLESPEGAGP